MAKKISSHLVWSVAVKNLAIIALVAFALWYTHDLWSFLGLLFLFSLKQTDNIKTQCPKCDHVFVAVEKDDDEDDEKENDS